MNDRQFYADHLRSNSDQQQETPPGEMPEVVNIQNVPSTVNTGEPEEEMLLVKNTAFHNFFSQVGIGIGLLKIHIAASKAELHEITV